MSTDFTPASIGKMFSDVGYVSSDEINYAVFGCVEDGTPLIVEGAPGVGKTELAKATARMLGLPLKRVQFYEGLTPDRILFDINYQKQLVVIQTIRSNLDKEVEGLSAEDAIKKMSSVPLFGREFIIERPILESINGKERCVLLLDEIDKSSEEIEYTLLQFLDEFAVTIPEYGTITCSEDMKPIVFLTSNNYRELSDALRRRCNYLYIEPKSKSEMSQILINKAKVSPELAEQISDAIERINALELKQPPSVAEAIAWAKHIDKFKGKLTSLSSTIHMIAKNNRDRQKIIDTGIMARKGMM